MGSFLSTDPSLCQLHQEASGWVQDAHLDQDGAKTFPPYSMFPIHLGIRAPSPPHPERLLTPVYR